MVKFSKAVSGVANIAAIIALVFMFGHIVVEIFLRNVFSSSTFVLDEFVGYAVSGLTFLALGESLRTGVLIRVTLLHDNIGAKGGKILDIFALLSALSVGCFGAWYIGKSVVRSFDRGTTSSSIAEVPQWIPEAFILVGLSVFVLQALSGLIERLTTSAEAE